MHSIYSTEFIDQPDSCQAERGNKLIFTSYKIIFTMLSPTMPIVQRKQMRQKMGLGESISEQLGLQFYLKAFQ